MKRRGRKIGTFTITAGDGANTILASIDYSIDSRDGWFFATYEDKLFCSESRADLEKTLKVLCRERYSLDYDPYIDIEMPTAFADDTTVVGLKFNLVWISKQQVVSYGNKQNWLEKRGYFEDGDRTQPKQNVGYPTTRESLKDLLPYTPERYARLEQIEQAIETIHDRLKAVLADVKTFDALTDGSLLALPAQKVKP